MSYKNGLIVKKKQYTRIKDDLKKMLKKYMKIKVFMKNERFRVIEILEKQIRKCEKSIENIQQELQKL